MLGVKLAQREEAKPKQVKVKVGSSGSRKEVSRRCPEPAAGFGGDLRLVHLKRGMSRAGDLLPPGLGAVMAIANQKNT
jgi:hypothetical protein